jgi:putative sterol carrier protein
MKFEEIWLDVKKSLEKADTSKLEGNFAIQCNIQGEGEGAFYIAFIDGALTVDGYDYNDNNAQLFASGDTFMKMFSKKLDGMAAYEQGLLGFEGDVGVVLQLGSLEPLKSGKAAPKKKPEAAAADPAKAVKYNGPVKETKKAAPKKKK